MAERKRSKLIEILLNEAAITEVQLNRAKGGIHTNCEVYSLISAGYISDIKVIGYVTKNTRVPYVILPAYEIDKEVLRIVPEEYCSVNCCLPVQKLVKDLTVAMVDPLDEQVIEELRDMTNMIVRPVLCSLRDFLDVMKSVWIDVREEAAHSGEENTEANIAGS